MALISYPSYVALQPGQAASADYRPDTLIELTLQLYYPGLETHTAVTGGVSHLLRASPRWRGTARWQIQYRQDALDIEAMFLQLTGGLNWVDLPLHRCLLYTSPSPRD